FNYKLCKHGYQAAERRSPLPSWHAAGMTGQRPPDYRAPTTVWVVEYADEREPGAHYQFGAFTTGAQALRLAERERAEGWADVWVNLSPVHDRVEDWEWDR